MGRTCSLAVWKFWGADGKYSGKGFREAGGWVVQGAEVDCVWLVEVGDIQGVVSNVPVGSEPLGRVIIQ